MSDMNELIGKTISAVYPSPDVIYFETDDGVWGYNTEGDCCSHSWFESITGTEALFGRRVLKTIEEQLGSEENHPQHDYLQIYGIRIVTDKGRAVIEFRNSSNGYYGGWVNRGSREDSVPVGLKPIQDDWNS